MGGRLARLGARQHPDLTASAPPAPNRLRVLILALLAVDGVLSALMAVFFLPLRIGAVPLPVSALVSGILNAALVWVGLQWTSVPRLAALPLWTWLATVVLCTVVGPGDDIVLGGVGIMEFGPILLVALGALPAAWVLMRHPASAGAGSVTGAG
ncbi:hypothetical protein [Mycobacterium sp. NAZ190054]|uniref:hypothetical protein n=1 Tax=Mycobacterium sp. NAZ190054 TaxID=1747766 RepID=UPI000792BB5C|nr:hypothetical protein [Mycobacterium sp. NAZ190054]KWX67207.1 hypothetical protein ASJ79_22605 [Mycobacterium sp. NAZ190054]